ncbi:MAG: autotransporter-associated beta strand repeat-containing protein, partial [Prosthecobacter sp.]|nr:autotransporter-associated beta strand repeat-containing protein [Prosthecobacter sp.]
MSCRHQPTPGQRLVAGLLVLTQFFWLPQARSADFYWDTDSTSAGNLTDGTGLGGTGDWNTTTSANWWDQSNLVLWPNANTDTAIFSGPTGALTASTVTLSSGIIANKLSFLRSGYTLTDGSLTLAGATPTLHANLGESATINSLIQGVDGLTKTGGGSIRLGNAANSYTGVTTISNGTLIISNQGALGTDASTVVVSGSASRGFGGGQLVLDGTSAGINFSRNLSLQGLGPIADRSASLISLGSNELSGTVSGAVGLVSTRITSSGGRLTLSGTLDVAGTAATTITGLGAAANSTGTSSYAVTGVLTGTGTLEKTGSGTLLLNPSNTSGFSGTVRAGSSSTGTISSIRITTPNVLGTRIAGGTGGVIDMNSGTLEVRMDSPSVLSGNLPATVYLRAASTLFADHAIGGSTINGTATFGTSSFEDNITTTFNSRNGYGMTFGSTLVNGGDNVSGFTTNMGGLLTFNGNFWNNADNAASRVMTITSTGNSLITGNIIASAAAFDHGLTKAGVGMLTITSNGSTLDGTVSVNAGILGITDFRAINNNSATINIGSGTTVGTLQLINDLAASAAGLTTSKTINLPGTTAAANIYASQTGSNPVILNGAITATGVGAKTLTLGGTNTANNIVNGSIPDGATATVTSLAKNGPGTWVLAGANAYTGATTITNGTLKIQDTFAGSSRNVIASTGAITFNAVTVTGEAGATLEYVGAAGSASAESLGALTPTAGANTVRVTPGAGGTAGLTFTSLGTVNGSASVNFVVPAGNSITVTGQSGYVANRLYFNGADYAFFATGVVRAPIYGSDALFSAADTFTSGNHALITASGATAAITQKSVKLEGNVTLTLDGNLTLTNGTNTAGNLLATGGSSVMDGAGAITGPGTNVLGIRVNGGTDTLTINNNIIGGTGGLNKNGAGKLILNGTANTITGETRINEGEIELGAGSRLGGDGSTTFTALTMRGAGVLDVGGNSIGVAAINGSGVITNDGADATLTVGNANGTGTWNGVFQDGSGALNVTKTGTGAQTWSGLSTHTGATIIGSTGLVTVNTLADIGQASGIGAGNAATNAGSLIFNGSTGGLVYTGTVLNGAIAAGSVSATTNRLFTLAGTGATLSSTASNNNAIIWSNTGAIVHGIIGPQTLTLTGTSAGDNRFNPQLTDSDTGANITGITKTGTGVWVLGNSNNIYTGLTTVSNGTLILGSAGALPAGSPLVLSGTATAGTLETSGNFIRDLAATATAGTGTVTWGGVAGGGFAAAGDNLVVAIGGLASPTPLQWGTGGFVASGAVLLLNSTTATGEIEVRNAIDLNGGARTITVNDNVSTGTDFATISGVISNSTGTGSLVKA